LAFFGIVEFRSEFLQFMVSGGTHAIGKGLIAGFYIRGGGSVLFHDMLKPDTNAINVIQ
jgi:hypothetical protein